MRLAALIVGVIAVLMGLLWIGQGLGWIRWPASSFMIDRRPWVTNGAVLVAIGLVVIIASKVRR
jgi:hypothetical protein